MKLAGCNAFSVGIFSWVAYEPEEGTFTFDWLDEIMARMAEAGSKVFLATPSGAKPAWLSYAYPEVCRVLENGLHEPHQGPAQSLLYLTGLSGKNRHHQSKTGRALYRSPGTGWVALSMNTAVRCYCDLCKAAFRDWLRNKYETLEALNRAWWGGFWSHTVTRWELIDPCDVTLDGLWLDWNRFITYQTADFMAHEKAAIRTSSDAPVTTNMMGTYDGLDYWRIAEVCDVIADDSYPQLHDPADNSSTLSYVAMNHDMHRAMKAGQPFVLMESCPSATNWFPIYKVKRPGMHKMEMLQAVGHGADATMYFQWRKGQGAGEKFHGAVVDHEGSERTRVFQDVASWGAELRRLAPVIGTSVEPEVALIHDWEVRWALEISGGPSDKKKQYVETCHQHYKPFWQAAVPVDVIESQSDFSPYRLLIAPMLYMLKPGVAARLGAFVSRADTLVLGYLSGIVNESNLCFLGGWPGDGLRQLSGIWSEEFDSIREGDQQQLRMNGSLDGLNGTYQVKDFAC